jgi:YHS domain-containing protein
MAMVKDPVCGMQVDDKTAKFQSNHQGKTYFFCSEDCKRKFDQSPQQYGGRR